MPRSLRATPTRHKPARTSTPSLRVASSAQITFYAVGRGEPVTPARLALYKFGMARIVQWKNTLCRHKCTFEQMRR